jgi:DNA-directed RNA polymerase subunit L
MEIQLQGQCQTLGSLLRHHLDRECPEDFATCTVVHPKDDHLLVCVPDVGTLRRALLAAKQEVVDLEVYIQKTYTKN